MKLPELNLLAAWIGILLGFVSGCALGLCFHRENWLGGYGAFKRRLYRLGHISFFGLGVVNLLFYFTVQSFAPNPFIVAAGWTFILGAISMPICCLLMAHFPRARLLFAVPVLNLITGGLLTVLQLIK
ncbi:MAG: hypothetical protein ACTHLW_02640 [Verrucomicrobiota bacterium]